jgi:hypothetical protein
MGGASRCGPVGGNSNKATVDQGTGALVSSPAPGICLADDEAAFHDAVDALRATLVNAGATGTWDSAIRARYDLMAREYRAETAARVRKGLLTWRQAAEEAHGLRNQVRELIRARSTPVGRAWAEFLKKEGPTFNAVVAKKTIDTFGSNANFNTLSPAQQNTVFEAVVQSAGKSDPGVNKWMQRVGRAGRGLLLVSVAISVYTVATAEDQGEAAKHEGKVWGAGILGGVAGGAAAGLVCGPGAPVCVTIGAFVGGVAATFFVD